MKCFTVFRRHYPIVFLGAPLALQKQRRSTSVPAGSKTAHRRHSTSCPSREGCLQAGREISSKIPFGHRLTNALGKDVTKAVNFYERVATVHFEAFALCAELYRDLVNSAEGVV
jgi:hypothetical protein